MATISVTLPADGTTADVADYNTPLNTIVNEFNGNIDNANIKTAAAISGSKLADNSIDLEAKASTDTGWREVTDSWAYASATTITVPSDATAKYSVGDKIRLTQSTVKYFYIAGVSSTVLTISGGTDYTLTNAAISDISYSKSATPAGFPQYFAWTPTWANFTIGNGTNVCKFWVEGKTCHYRIVTTLGSTSSMGTAPTFTLPATSAATPSTRMPIGEAYYSAASTTLRPGVAQWATTTTANLLTLDVNADTGSVTATSPYGGGWLSGYVILVNGSFELP